MANNSGDFERNRAQLITDLDDLLDKLNRRESELRGCQRFSPEAAAVFNSARSAYEMARELALHLDGPEGLKHVFAILEGAESYQKAILVPWPPPSSLN
jgi:hypothetical protein